MLSKSSGIGLATIIAALVTGIFTFFASKQILRVEVTLPDKGQERLSIEAASNKIEDLSRKLTLAETEIASLQEQVRNETDLEEVSILSDRIRSLEEELRSKDRLIAGLSQGQERPEHQRNTFKSRLFEIAVVSVDAAPEEIVLVVEVTPQRDEPVDFVLNAYGTFVLDKEGNRWGAIGKVRDTLGIVSFNTAFPTELIPGTAVRSRISFEADVLSSERPPDPQPPLTFIATEASSKQRLVIEDLQPR